MSDQRLHLVESGTLADLKAAIQRLEDINRALVRENSGLVGEVSGLMHTVRRQASEIVALKGDNTKHLKAQAETARITTLLQTWRDCLGHPKANIDVDGKRADVVRKAFRRGHTAPPLPCDVHDPEKPVKDAVCTVWDELDQAIRGLALRPYVVNYRRARVGTAKQRYDKVENALGNEELVEKFRGYWLAATVSPAKLIWAEKERVERQADLLRDLAWEIVKRPDGDVPAWLAEEIRAVIEYRAGLEAA